VEVGVHEDRKLREAEFFLKRMGEVESVDWDAFTYNASAFLSAARSVLQYAMKEMGQPPNEARSWYDAFCAGKAAFRFLKAVRDVNIHRVPFEANQAQVVTVFGRSFIFEGPGPGRGLVVKSLRDQDGNAIPFEMRPRNLFVGWREFAQGSGEAGREDVMQLCTRYLADLKEFVAEARRQGFVSCASPQ
jgi:hypothetical protein